MRRKRAVSRRTARGCLESAEGMKLDITDDAGKTLTPGVVAVCGELSLRHARQVPAAEAKTFRSQYYLPLRCVPLALPKRRTWLLTW